jgi:hypothetical protein
MIVTNLWAGPERDRPDHSSPAQLGARLVVGLAGRAPDRILRATDPGARSALGRSDLVIVCAGVCDGAVPSDLLALLHYGCDLRSTIAFLATVGPWPAEVATAERCLLPLVTTAGATCVAPLLHVTDSASPTIAAYCRYWAPPIMAALGGRGRGGVAA